MILRGCRLRNTEHAIGIAVFTGHDSKVMMNSTNAKYKFSSLELMSNKAILAVLCIQFVLAILGGLCGTSWLFDEAIKNSEGVTPAWYLNYGYQSDLIKKDPNFKHTD